MDGSGDHRLVGRRPGVMLANVFGTDGSAADVAVSLCRVGREQLHSPERAEVWLLDVDDPAANPNVDFVLADLARTIVAWRDAGKTVLIHCVQAERRTPAVAAAYLAERLGISGREGWEKVRQQLPGARPNRSFMAALEGLWPMAPTTAPP
jgi:ADP-ribosyl-[dinitrogen reductase] hydrolase